MKKTWIVVLCAVAIGAIAAAAAGTTNHRGTEAQRFLGVSVSPCFCGPWEWLSKPAAFAAAPLPRVQGTLPPDLDAALSIAQGRLAADPADAAAAVRAAEILLRKARVERSASYAIQAEKTLEALLDEDPSEYSALKMLGAVYASQHRFHEAIAVAKRAIAMRGRDAWNYGTLGDSYLELGEWDRAFDAFDEMVRLRPDSASYARVAYAHELQGQLPEALRLMRMAAEATNPSDRESLAWHAAQVGNILLKMGDVDGAAREFARADYIFPGHPDARDGLAKVSGMASVNTNHRVTETQR